MRGNIMKRLLCVMMVIALLSTYALPAFAAEDLTVTFKQVDNNRVSAKLSDREPVEFPEEQAPYADTEVVRVSIVLEKASTIEAGYTIDGIAGNDAAMAYRGQLEEEQTAIVSKIEAAIEKDLDVVWNLTLAANIISANVAYGDIAAIEQVSGVKQVVIETRYEPDVVSTGAADPNMATSTAQIGSTAAWAAGYTGAGSKIAIIDTGIDMEHEAFNSAAFDYSLSQLDKDLELMDAAAIASVLAELNAYKRSNFSAEDLYVNSKIAFGFNYIDRDSDIIHLNDNQGEHGSHVAGIASANAYVENADGTFSPSLNTTFVQGVAPDAQLIVMKVFGKGGGAYDSDYMAAIEDAIVLGADSVNLSLGSGNPGMSRSTGSSNELGYYEDILESLEKSGLVAVMSAGNSGAWMDSAESAPYLYLDDVSFQTNGSPGSFTNSLAVASVDNDGFTATYFTVGGKMVSYSETEYNNLPMSTLAGTKEYVFVNGIGSAEEFAAVGDILQGKIVMCYRGELSFYQKAEFAVEAGAVGVIIVNNQAGIINMDLTDYSYTAPCVSILQADGEIFKTEGTENTTESGITYWTGSMEISEGMGAGQYNSEYYTMSSFSSWGVPGSLELKPEITAPGGNIYSVAGANKYQGSILFGDHASYELMSGTSMAAPQVAGMVALVAQYIRESGLIEKTGLDERTLAQSLLMSTAVPLRDGNSDGNYYPVLQQGAGLGNVGAAVTADSYILMGKDATASYEDGKVKVELGDDPAKTGVYTFSFSINNLTDAEKTFALSADVFTQNAFANSNMLFLDTWTCGLNPVVTWTVDGKAVDSGEELVGLDFNGDGTVDSADGQILLDYATGLDVTLSNTDKADLNGDGEINSYDSYAFFSLLSQGGATVPANGSAVVTVTITLSDSDKAWLANYENGAYIEAYVYAQSLSTAEGVAGTTHSIPVLGYYGNWSDPSMFDKGSYIEYANGLENRAPYLYNTNFQEGNYNGLLITYADEPGKEYWFGGNPMVSDATYMPERDAISAANGDMISTIGFAVIRNAADSYYQVINAETGEAYISEQLGAVSSAYYYVNGGTWKNTFYTLNAGFVPTGIPNDTTVEVGLTLIPEYFVDAEGNVDWDALGDGVSFSMPMVVDNTAPVVDSVDIDTENNVLAVTATDNQYIAAVALFDSNGQNLFTYVGSDPDQAAGDTVDFVLDLSEVNGNGFLLQVYDYAYNITTYEIDTQLGELVDTIDSVELNKTSATLRLNASETLVANVLPTNASNRNVVWSSSDDTIVSVDDNGTITANAVGTAVITATAEADETKSASCTVTVVSVDFTIEGMLQDEVGNPMFFVWNMAKDAEWIGCAGVGTSMTSATIDTTNNKGYVMDDVANVWQMHQIDLNTGEILQSGDNTTGVPLWDMEYSTFFSTAENPLVHGVYYIYYFPAKNPMALDTSVFNLQSYLANYTGASYLVAIASAGYEQVSSQGSVYDSEHILMLDNAGYIWDFWTYATATGYSALLNYAPTDLASYGVNFPGNGDNMYTSMVVGEDGKLYVSAYTGDYNELFQLTYNAATSSYVSLPLGDFGKDVWPAILTSVTNNTDAGADSVAAPAPTMQLDAVTVSVEELAASLSGEAEAGGSLNTASGSVEVPAHPLSDAVVGEGKDTVTITITAKDIEGKAIDSTNGVTSVTYDADALALSSILVEGDYTAILEADGTVTFGYVSLDGIAADEVVATLIFEIKGEAESVTVTQKEVNDNNADYQETITIAMPEPEVIASGWSGYAQWTLTDDGVLTFTPSGQLENGQCNLRNYWKQGGVLNLPWGAYADMITTVVIEDGIHDIGQMAFYALPNLKNVVLGADVVEIRNYAFKNCVSLTSVTGTEGLEFIREGAFYGCSALKEMVIPEDCVVEEWAFSRSGITLN